MTAIADKRIDAIVARHEGLEARLGSGTLDGPAFVQASKDFSELEPIVAAARALRKLRADRAEAEAMLAEAAGDAELKAMAQDEIAEIDAGLPDAEHALAVLMLPKDAADDRPAMLEIRAGTGGDEAALFAGDLLRMYSKYAETMGWRVEIISASVADVGGYKEVIASVQGSGVFAKLKFESGVHRVQRVPVTESGGRIHTSAATVAVLPEAAEVDMTIDDKDLRIDIYRASGAGGQHVNTTDSAVRLTHIPSGLVVIQQDERSQHKNRAKAMQVLRTRLYDFERAKIQKAEAGARKAMVGSGDRSERIRTYNFPQGRVTDHRINLTLHRLPEILEGALGEMIDTLIAEDQAERLAGMQDG